MQNAYQIALMMSAVCFAGIAVFYGMAGALFASQYPATGRRLKHWFYGFIIAGYICLGLVAFLSA